MSNEDTLLQTALFEKRKYKRIKEISKIKIDNTKIYFARISPVAPHIMVLTTDLIAV